METNVPSPRWHAPEHDAQGGFWRARLRAPDAVGVLDQVAYGPDRAACLRETRRMDAEQERYLGHRRWITRASGPDYLVAE